MTFENIFPYRPRTIGKLPIVAKGTASKVPGRLGSKQPNSSRSFPGHGERRVRRHRVIFERRDRADTMIGVATGIAVGQSRGDFSQVSGADRLGAQRARRLPAGRPAIHQDKSHGMPPNPICVVGVARRRQGSSTAGACIKRFTTRPLRFDMSRLGQ